MSIVKLLAPDVISKIAAGEVVERPASVVKELIENALDAGATRIEISLKDGGKSLIHIRDNGKGIADEDMNVLFTRHATSKIVFAQDLEQVLSFGFRGEALYSISSVSEVVCQSRLIGKQDAWQIVVCGGKKGEITPTSLAQQGTDIKVENLFFNTPARRKFLKSIASEAEACVHVLISAALARPDVQFICRHQGKILFDFPAVETLKERAAKALKLPFEHIYQADGFKKEDHLSWRMVIGDINISRQRRDLQYVFVNGRPVQNKSITFFMNEAFSLIFPKGSFGFFIVLLDIPAEEVDVNVHPTKKEVRLHKENEIGLSLKRFCEDLLMTKTPAKIGVLTEPIFPFIESSSSLQDVKDSKETLIPASLLMEEKNVYQSKQSFKKEAQASLWKPLEEEKKEIFSQKLYSNEESLGCRLSKARFIGTFDQKYHLLEEKGSLFVIDQHAAQERILFERLRLQIASRQVEKQMLVMPVLVHVNPKEMIVFEELATTIETMGFDVTMYDEQTLAIQAHPIDIKNSKEALLALLARETMTTYDVDVLARRACRASVMSGDKMFDIEVQEQIKNLLLCQDPYTCPHGRPVVIELKTSFLDRQFLRTS